MIRCVRCSKMVGAAPEAKMNENVRKLLDDMAWDLHLLIHNFDDFREEIRNMGVEYAARQASQRSV